MGIVYTQNKELERAYPPEPSGKLSDFLVNPSQENPTFELAGLSADESGAILKKLDSMAPGWSPQVAMMVAEGAKAVIQAVRLVKAQSKQEFRGIFGQGAGLDLRWLRPKDIGGAILSPATTTSVGLYAGTGAAVYTWLSTLTVNTNASPIPSQTMELYAALVYFGFINPIENPPEDVVEFQLYGVTAPAQSCDFRQIKTINGNELYVARLEKPVIVPPLGIQRLRTYPTRSGDTKFQPLCIVVARAQELLI